MSERTPDSVSDVVIVGSGVAGLSAAVYAARADLEPTVLEAGAGWPADADDRRRELPGLSDGVGGMELIQRGKEQAERFGAEFEHATVEEATLENRPFELELSNGNTLRTRALIVATGASARWSVPTARTR